MISVKKDFENIPFPLSKEHCEDGRQRRTATTNENKRKELIKNQEYIDTSTYNDRYKHNEIKTRLVGIYNGKCAFCEQKEELMHVEHYRPKQKYYWLFLSWDNLLLACAKCNGNKSTHFPIENTTVIAPKNDCSDLDLSKINHFCKEYDDLEQPLLLNPEQEKDLHFRFSFDRNGVIYSANPLDKKAKQTIATIELDRDYLNIKRKKIINDFENNIKDRVVKNKGELKRSIMHEIKMLKQKANFEKSDEDFLTFRNYILKEGIINEVIKIALAK